MSDPRRPQPPRTDVSHTADHVEERRAAAAIAAEQLDAASDGPGTRQGAEVGVPQASSVPRTVITSSSVEEVEVRRSPRYGRFLVLGALLGALLAGVLTVAFPPNPDVSQLRVFGFLALFCVPAGCLALGLFAIIADWALGKRTGRATAVHEVFEAPRHASAAPELEGAPELADPAGPTAPVGADRTAPLDQRTV